MGATKLASAPTHSSPISRMLLRYRWQSCRTCRQGDKGGGWRSRAGRKAQHTDPCWRHAEGRLGRGR